MFPKLQLMLATTLALAIVPIAGFAVSVGAAEQGNHQRGGHHRGGGDHGGMMGFMGPLAKDLKLTDAQKAQMKAIAQKYRTQGGVDHKAQRQQLKTLLSAPKVDGNALRAFLNARVQEMDAQGAKRAAMMTEMRAVLTNDQRAQLLKSLNAERPQQARPNQGNRNNPNKADGQRGKFGERMVKDLNLNANQKAAFNALQAKWNANAGAPANRQAHRQALAKFIETGDATAFQTTLKGTMAGKLPVNELVAFAESLDQAQRQKVLNKLERFGMGGGQGRHGGRGHH